MNLENKALNFLNVITTQTNSAEFYKLFTLDRPIMFTTSMGERLYLFYVLQDRYVKRNGKRAKVLEVMKSETNFDSIIKLLEGKLSIYDVLDESKDKERVGQIGKKIFPRKKVGTISDVSDNIPKPNYMLDGSLHNDECIQYQLKRLKERKNLVEQFNFNQIMEINKKNTNCIDSINTLDDADFTSVGVSTLKVC